MFGTLVKKFQLHRLTGRKVRIVPFALFELLLQNVIVGQHFSSRIFKHIRRKMFFALQDLIKVVPAKQLIRRFGFQGFHHKSSGWLL